MFTLQELNEHKKVLESLLDSNCVCMNNPEIRESITETLSVAHAMLTAVTTQLENQSISFTP
jgi:trehalose-6-phosphate synthase